MSIIPEGYINSVVSLGMRTPDGEKWIGTGFFVIRFAGSEQKEAFPMLVTNKHVVNNRDTIILRMRKQKDNTLVTLDVALIQDGQKIYWEHPETNIDIAVIPLNGQYINEQGLVFYAFDIDNNTLSSEELRQNGVDEGALIYMLGYPLGLVNIHSATPVCRLGCIARISASQIEETKNFLIDIQNFPGNSGSPIISRPEFIAIQNTKSFDKSVLIGIVHSYIPYQETLINTQTNQIVEVRSENSGIALVHPVEYIKELIDTYISRQSNNIDS